MFVLFTADGSHHVSDKSWVPWLRLSLGDAQFFDHQNRSVLVPADGVYFVYTSFSLSCSSSPEAFRLFSVKLQHLPQGYDEHVDLMKVQDGLDCPRRPPIPSRSVFVGQLFRLWAGDRLSVWLEEGSELVQQSWFGFSLQWKPGFKEFNLNTQTGPGSRLRTDSVESNWESDSSVQLDPGAAGWTPDPGPVFWRMGSSSGSASGSGFFLFYYGPLWDPSLFWIMMWFCWSHQVLVQTSGSPLNWSQHEDRTCILFPIYLFWPDAVLWFWIKMFIWFVLFVFDTLVPWSRPLFVYLFVCSFQRDRTQQ